MLKNLEDKFNFYCDSENLELNHNQFLVIKKLQDYHKKNFRSLFLEKLPGCFLACDIDDLSMGSHVSLNILEIFSSVY